MQKPGTNKTKIDWTKFEPVQTGIDGCESF